MVSRGHVVASLRSVRLNVSIMSTSSVTCLKSELDSHADTCVVGKHALVVHEHNRMVNVFSYDPKSKGKPAKIVDALVKYVDPFTGAESLIMINQAIHVDYLDHNLICPMQCRLNGVTVNDTPKFLTDNPTEESHSMILTDPEDAAHQLSIHLELDGVISYFETCKPTQEEYEQSDLPLFELTAPAPDWDPSDPSLREQEASLLDFRGQIIPVDKSTSRGRYRHRLCEVSQDSGDAGLIRRDDDSFALMLEQNVAVTISEVTTRPKIALNHLELAKRWGIPPDRAKQTVQMTTQRGIRTILNPTLSRRFSTNDRHLRYRRLPHYVYQDTMFSSVKSTRGNSMSQVFATPFAWSRNYPMARRSQAHEAVGALFNRVGVPLAIISDNAKEEVLGKLRQKLVDAHCPLRQTEPYSPWSNSAELEIRELKKATGRRLLKSGAPKRLWDYCLELESLIRSHTAHDIFKLNGRTPEAMMMGETPDISYICEFGWYDWVMFRDEVAPYPEPKLVLGRYLGPSVDVGPAMSARIIKANGQVVDRSTFRHLTADELQDEVHKATRDDFTKLLHEKLGSAATFADLTLGGDGGRSFLLPTPEHIPYDDVPFDILEEELMPTPESGDEYVNAEVMLPRGNAMQRGRVVKRKRDDDGNIVGTANANPILDTRVYEVMFPDGEVTELAANTIATSMYAQCDVDGNEYLLLEAFVDHQKSDAALTLEQQKTNHNGRPSIRKSTAGWKLCCQWLDGSTSWVRLSELKESHPVQVAEYAVAAGIDHEPAFNWWVRHVLKKRDRIIAQVKQRNARYLKKTHKFGIEMPKSVQEALELDKKNGNNLWGDAIKKEMQNVRIAFDILPDGTTAPIGYQHVRCHMIFDVKMEDFRRKARLVAGGHTTEAPPTLTYASVVSRETVRIALTMAALHGLPIMAADVMNAYVTAPNKEKIWTTLGPEFGSDCGKKAIIVRALYGLKSAGAAFRSHLGECMRNLGYKPCLADPDLWMKPEYDPSDSFKYWSYILCYVDDILVIHHQPEDVIKKIDKYFPLKPGSVGKPDMYLGTKLREITFTNGEKAWAMSPSKYVQESVSNCVKHVKANMSDMFNLPKKAINPFPTDYEPMEDGTPELDAEHASYYQQLIGIMRWMVEIGRIDIDTQVSMLASHVALPRQGHMSAALHIMAYLRDHHNSRMVFDAHEPEIVKSDFKKYDWQEFYRDAKEALPPNMPPARGRAVDLRLYVDSDHAGDKVTRRSRTGYIIYLNSAPIQWLSKKQSTVETSVFGAEFVAMKHGIETVRGIRYKLRMMGIEVDNPTYVYGDNMSVVTNSSKPESQLKKKCNSICYHAVRESVAMGESLVSHISTDKNPADLMTKTLVGVKRRFLVSKLLYDIYDDHGIAKQ